MQKLHSKQLRFALLFSALFFNIMHFAYASDEVVQPSASSGVFIFSANEFKLSAAEYGETLIANGLNEPMLKRYVEGNGFGFKEFSEEVAAHSSKLAHVMVIFSFHGADAGGCNSCNDLQWCTQGNLCAEEDRYISAQQIVDDFIIPLQGKQVAILFKSCFSGHFAKKVHELSSQIVWKKPTPLALIATDNNDKTSNVCFPLPKYSRQLTSFNHWKSMDNAALYEKMENFFDFTQFMNAVSDGFFTFSFFELNGGKDIGIGQFGFYDPNLKPLQEQLIANQIYENIDNKLAHVDVSDLIVLFAESERSYENLAYNDMWLNAILQKGVAKENIHWIKPSKTAADMDNPHVHGFFEEFNFIQPHQKVLLFIRGDDDVVPTIESIFSTTKTVEWWVQFGADKLLSAKRIAEGLIAKIKHAQRVLVLLCSAHADIGLSNLVPLIDRDELRNIAVVSFFAPDRKTNFSKMAGWPMGFLAPLYEADFLFRTSAQYLNVFHSNKVELREHALRGLSLFKELNSFHDYVAFIREMAPSMYNSAFDVVVHNTHETDLEQFGFMPKTVPANWRGW